MKLTHELAEIIRKKFIEQVKLTEAEALKWNAYLTSVERAVKRQAYQDATPEQRIAIRKATNDAFAEACKAATATAVGNRAFLEEIVRILIQAVATALLSKIEKI